ncbi:hypothetical protein CERSUDRAFT_78719, partial [Gelatoporia subvermispora B]
MPLKTRVTNAEKRTGKPDMPRPVRTKAQVLADKKVEEQKAEEQKASEAEVRKRIDELEREAEERDKKRKEAVYKPPPKPRGRGKGEQKDGVDEVVEDAAPAPAVKKGRGKKATVPSAAEVEARVQPRRGRSASKRAGKDTSRQSQTAPQEDVVMVHAALRQNKQQANADIRVVEGQEQVEDEDENDEEDIIEDPSSEVQAIDEDVEMEQ